MNLWIQNLNVGYELNKPILKDINIDFKKEAVNLLVGPSGSGKSTLSFCLNGLIPHSVKAEIMGNIIIGEEKIIGQEPSYLAGRIGLVFQDPDTQFATYTVEDELVFGMENLNFPQKRIEDNLEKYIALLKLEAIKDRPVNTLSGGEKQRVAIASILTMEPEIIVFDEPTSNLDGETRTFFFTLIKQLKNKYAKTIIIIEHNLEEIIEQVDQISILDKKGKYLYTGEIQAVLEKYRNTSLEIYDFLAAEIKDDKYIDKKELIAWLKENISPMVKLQRKKSEKLKTGEAILRGENIIKQKY